MDENVQDEAGSNILDELDDLDKAIIKLKIEGFKNVDIAEKTGKSRGTIAIHLKKFKVQQAIDELQKTALNILVDAQSDAARTLRTIIRNKKTKDTDKIAACREVLKGVLSEKITIDSDLDRKIHEYLDDEDLGHIEDEESI